jgi:hypothetical protein
MRSLLIHQDQVYIGSHSVLKVYDLNNDFKLVEEISL